MDSSHYRFRHDNVLILDLDLPERTTQDFDGTISQKLQETINIALKEDEEELAMISQEKMPNVYIENPDLISKVLKYLRSKPLPPLRLHPDLLFIVSTLPTILQENVLNNKPKRLQSAKKSARGRPQSGYKKY